MTQLATESPLAEQAGAVILLLKEYTEKLHDIIQQAQRLRRQAQRLRELPPRSQSPAEKNRLAVEFNVLQQLLNRLRPPMTRLAQHVSPMVEHGKMDEVARLELRLRLAEFEHILASTNQLLAANNPTSQS